MPPRIRVLAPSPDPELLRLRREMLIQAGFRVTSPPSEKEILAQIEHHHFDVLLLCHRWPALAMQELAEIFKRRNPEGCIIAIAAAFWRDELPMADLTVFAADGPQALIAAIKKCAGTGN